MNDMLEKPYTLEQCRALLQQWLPTAAKPVAAANLPPANRPAANLPAANAAGVDHNLLAAVDATTVVHLRTLRTDGSGDLYSELVELFQRTSAEALAELRTSLSQADLATAAAICHRLSAAAANVGALRFAQDTRRLEQHCRARSLALIRPLYERLQGAYPVLIEELMNISQRAIA